MNTHRCGAFEQDSYVKCSLLSVSKTFDNNELFQLPSFIKCECHNRWEPQNKKKRTRRKHRQKQNNLVTSNTTLSLLLVVVWGRVRGKRNTLVCLRKIRAICRVIHVILCVATSSRYYCCYSHTEHVSLSTYAYVVCCTNFYGIKFICRNTPPNNLNSTMTMLHFHLPC